MAAKPKVADYYAILNVKPSATYLEIQRSYRKLCRKWHGTKVSKLDGVSWLAMEAV